MKSPLFSSRSPFASRVVLPALALGAMALTSACGSRPFQAPDPKPEGQADKAYLVKEVRDLDILFMVDNSLSMKEEQENLRKNFPALIDSLRKIPGGLPNVHIGVVSSDYGAGNILITGNPACSRPGGGGDRGIFRTKATCGLQNGATFITSSENGTQSNFTGKLEDVFSCIAELGTGGCGFEHQLESVRNGLRVNEGFLRPDAFLAIVLITDEDDCSAPFATDFFVQDFSGTEGSLRCNIAGHVCKGKAPRGEPFSEPLAECEASPDGGGRLFPIAEITKSVFDLKPGFPEKIIVSAITGLPPNDTSNYKISLRKQEEGPDAFGVEPVCESMGGKAAPALRLKKFVDAFGSNGTMDSICKDDFSPALKRIGDLIAARLDPSCVQERLIDTDPAKAGLQPECTVLDRVPDAMGGFTDKALPACGNGAALPCWNLLAPGAADNQCSAGQARVVVDRGGMDAPKNTLQIVKCRTCAKNSDTRCPG